MRFSLSVLFLACSFILSGQATVINPTKLLKSGTNDDILQTVGGVATWVAPSSLQGAFNYWTLSGGNVYRATGNVGINIASPAKQLDVNGALRVSSVSSQSVNGYADIFTTYDATKGELWLQPEGCIYPTKLAANGGLRVGAPVASPPARGLSVQGAINTRSSYDMKDAVGGNSRWSFSLDGTETGSGNSGGNLALYRFADAGGYLGTQMYLNRATGTTSFGTSSAGSTVNIYGNMSIGSGYVGTAAPVGGIIVQGNALFGTSTDDNANRLQVTGNAIADKYSARPAGYDVLNGAGSVLGTFRDASGVFGYASTNDVGIKSLQSNHFYVNGDGSFPLLSLKWDKKVGINTVTPLERLHIKGAATNSYFAVETSAYGASLTPEFFGMKFYGGGQVHLSSIEALDRQTNTGTGAVVIRNMVSSVLTEAMRVDGTNVLIGSTVNDNNYKVQINSGSNALRVSGGDFYRVIRFETATQGVFEFGTLGGGFIGMQSLSNASGFQGLRLQPNGGNLVIGTHTDDGTNKLQVNGSVKATNYINAGYYANTIQSDVIVQRDPFTFTGSGTGVLDIEAPFGWNDRFTRVEISGYNYAEAAGNWSLSLSFYPYAGSSVYVYPQGTLSGNAPFTESDVKLSYKNGKVHIMLGTVSTVWLYSTTTVSKIQTSATIPLTGWSAAITTSIVTGYTANTAVTVAPNHLYLRGANNSYLHLATTGGYDVKIDANYDGAEPFKLTSQGVRTVGNMAVSGVNSGYNVSYLNGYYGSGLFYGGTTPSSSQVGVLVNNSGRVTVGTAVDDGTGSKLQVAGGASVNGTITAGANSATSGNVLLKAKFDSWPAQAIITEYSSAAIGLASNMYQSGSATWKSSFNYGAAGRAAMLIDATGLRMLTASSQNVAGGSDLTSQPTTMFSVGLNGYTAIAKSTAANAALDVNGNANIGTTTGSVLSLNTAQNNGTTGAPLDMSLRFNGYGGGLIAEITSQDVSGSQNKGYLQFKTRTLNASTATEKMRLNDTGNLLVNSTTDNGVDKVQITGSTKITSTLRLGSATVGVIESGSGGAQFTIWNKGTVQFPITTSSDPTGLGNGDVWTNLTSGDHKIKFRANDITQSIASVEVDFAGLGSWAASGAASITLDNSNRNLFCDANANAVTLVGGTSMKEGVPFRIKCRRNTINAITLSASGMGGTIEYSTGTTIPGPSTLVLDAYGNYEVTRIGSVLFVKKG